MYHPQQMVLAAQLLGTAEPQHWPVAYERAEYDRSVAAIRAHLDQALFATAWVAGRDMTREQIVPYSVGKEFTR